LHFANSLGDILFAALPLIQLDVQKNADFPLPTCTTVDAFKSSTSVLSHGVSRLFHARSFCFHLNQSHLNLNALANLSRSKIHRPPFSFGRHVVGQLIRECPPLTFSGYSPRHKKLLLILSVLLINHFCAGEAVR